MFAPVAAEVTHALLHAAPLLRLPELLVHRLVAAGFIDVWSERADVWDQVERLADRETLSATDVAVPMMIVHPGPLRPNGEFAWRKWVGVDVADRYGLGEYERLLAFSTGWRMDRATAGRLVGGIIAADVAGFLDGDHALRVHGFDEVRDRDGERRVRFYGEPLVDAERAFVSSTRVDGLHDENGAWDWIRESA